MQGIYIKVLIQFNTPFIKTRIEQYDYLKLLENLKAYLSTPIILGESGNNDLKINKGYNNISWGLFGYPIFKLQNVNLHAIRTVDTEEYIDSWNRRLSRVNNQNMFVMMIIENDDIAERFSKLSIKNKIGFLL